MNAPSHLLVPGRQKVVFAHDVNIERLGCLSKHPLTSGPVHDDTVKTTRKTELTCLTIAQ